jgi:hypothetical protein
MDENVRKVKINFILKSKELNLDFWIKIGNRLVQHGEKGFDNRDSLEKLHSKGVRDIYLKEDAFLEYINERISEKKIYDGGMSVEETLQSLKEDTNLLKEIFTDMGISEVKQKLITKIQDESLFLLKKEKNILNLFEKFKADGGDEILIKKELVTFVAINMLKPFTFFDHNQFSYMSLGILLCDLLLEADEYWISFNPKETVKSNKNIFTHTQKIVAYIPEGMCSPDLVNLLEQHHERPDGTGYPRNLQAQRISQLSAFYILAEEFVQEGLKVGFHRPQMITVKNNILKKYSKYTEKSKSFSNAAMGLNYMYEETLGDEKTSKEGES